MGGKSKKEKKESKTFEEGVSAVETANLKSLATDPNKNWQMISHALISTKARGNAAVTVRSTGLFAVKDITPGQKVGSFEGVLLDEEAIGRYKENPSDFSHVSRFVDENDGEYFLDFKEYVSYGNFVQYCDTEDDANAMLGVKVNNKSTPKFDLMSTKLIADGDEIRVWSGMDPNLSTEKDHQSSPEMFSSNVRYELQHPVIYAVTEQFWTDNEGKIENCFSNLTELKRIEV
jgi:hypothetical protein